MLHQLTHWLSAKLEAIIPQKTSPGEPNRELGKVLELELLGGRMESYYSESDCDEFKIDCLVLLLTV